jgi:glycine cleavage system H lipoate-binding protein/ABC-type phosphate transport system substrate-binding protein
MKRTISLLISLLLLNFNNINSKELVIKNSRSSEDSMRIFSTPDLFNLSSRWASEYNKTSPELKIRVINVSNTKEAENLIVAGNIGIVSKEYYSGLLNESLLKVLVGRDIIVPIINSQNPFVDEIYHHGISPETFVRFINNPDSMKWGNLLSDKQKSAVNYYWINNESIKEDLADFLNTKQIKSVGIEVKSGEQMISAIQKDTYAFGFCKLINLLDSKNQSIIEGIKLMPIDKNGNGLIDFSEKIYDDPNVFTRGVWIGKYPKALFSNIYSISSKQPKNKTQLAFLKWIINDGQQFLYDNGYSDLLLSERQTAVDNLYNAKDYAVINTDTNLITKAIFLILVVLVAAGLIVDTTARYLKRKSNAAEISNSVSQPVLDENSLIIPKGLYFDKTHTWAFLEQNGVVKVGLDDFLQHVTGPITRLKMKRRGEMIKKGEQILSIIQNGKQLNLYAPVSGIIKEQNVTLETDPSLINFSPYNNGWIYLIEPSNWLGENKLLFMAEKQKAYIKNEFSRLKDFLAGTFNADAEKYARLILQDGGELRDGILSDLGPEVWEDFQTKFIDPSRQLGFYDFL